MSSSEWNIIIQTWDWTALAWRRAGTRSDDRAWVEAERSEHCRDGEEQERLHWADGQVESGARRRWTDGQPRPRLSRGGSMFSFSSLFNPHHLQAVLDAAYFCAGLSVCLCVGHTGKNGKNDWDAVWSNCVMDVATIITWNVKLIWEETTLPESCWSLHMFIYGYAKKSLSLQLVPHLHPKDCPWWRGILTVI